MPPAAWLLSVTEEAGMTLKHFSFLTCEVELD